MHKTIKLVCTLLFVFSSQAHAIRIDLTTEPNGLLGSSLVHEKDGVEVTINAYYYDLITNEVSSGVVLGIDGVANPRHPAGIGVGKSETSINPPGLDNVGGKVIDGVDHQYLEFLIFSFDSTVVVTEVETEGLGPHGTSVNYWGGLSILDNDFDVTDLGAKLTVDETEPAFSPDPDLGVVSWFAVGAKPEDAFNVFSIQGIQFSVADAPSEVPVPAAFWLFFSGIIGLLRYKKIA